MCFYWYFCTFYIGFYIDIYVWVVQFTDWWYFLLIVLFCISNVHRWFCHCVTVKYVLVSICLWTLYLCLLKKYVFRMVYSLFVVYIGKRGMYLYLSIIPLLPYLLTWINRSLLTPPCLILPVSCHIHWSTYFLNIFCCILLLKYLFTFHIKYSKTCNHNHLYTISGLISSLLCFIFGRNWLQCVTLTTKEVVYLPSDRPIGCMKYYRFLI